LAARSNVIATRTLVLALGANTRGLWGEPRETLARTCGELGQAGLVITGASPVYSTAPVGPGRQPRYLNAVIVAEASLAPAALLRLLKRLERRAGRGPGRHWGPRPLDIDIIDDGGRVLGWPPARRRRGRLILPHPEMHTRAFVLVPLLDVLPFWRHPVFGVAGKALLRRLAPRERANVRQVLDFRVLPCDYPC